MLPEPSISKRHYTFQRAQNPSEFNVFARNNQKTASINFLITYNINQTKSTTANISAVLLELYIEHLQFL